MAERPLRSWRPGERPRRAAAPAAGPDRDPPEGQAALARGPAGDVTGHRRRAEDEHRHLEGGADAAAGGELRQSRQHPADHAGQPVYARRRAGRKPVSELGLDPPAGPPVLPLMLSRFVLAVDLARVVGVRGPTT